MFLILILAHQGRDFNPDNVLTVPEQVDKLILQSTSLENLCQCFSGWYVTFKPYLLFVFTYLPSSILQVCFLVEIPYSLCSLLSYRKFVSTCMFYILLWISNTFTTKFKTQMQLKNHPYP